MPQVQPPTEVITNFAGRLTRYINGDLNSGFAKFSSSFGYDFFSKPGSLTWLYQPDDIAGAIITDAILSAKVWSFDPTTRYVYAIGNSGKLYRINPTNSGSTITPLYDTPALLTTIAAGTPAFDYGSSMEFYNGKIFITSDDQINRVDFDGTNDTVVIGGSIQAGIYHPSIQFAGSLYIGNGNNLTQIDGTNLIVTTAKLSPALPSGMYISDLDITPDGNYMAITASYLYPENVSSPNSGNRGNPYALESYIFYWNGVDEGITVTDTLPSYPANSLNTFLDSQYFFLNDGFGGALFDGKKKLLTLPGNITPMQYGSAPNGTFITFANPEVTGTINSSTGGGQNTYTSLYYYGYLDSENAPGLWRMFRLAPTSGKAWRVPVNMMVNNYNFSTSFVLGWGKHYLSVWEDASPDNFHFYRFVLPPAANTAPILGVYETQTKLYSKRVGISAIRVYCEPTATLNGFQLDVIGSDGQPMDNGTFTYSYTAGSDITLLEGSLERINFNPNMAPTYAIGVRITNTGTSNMTILKIELDLAPAGQ